MDIIYINNINDGIKYSPLIEKNINSNFKYYSKYHMENVINKNIILLEDILIKRLKSNSNQNQKFDNYNQQQPFPFIKSEIGMNFKEKYAYSSIKDIEIKKKYLYDHTINQLQLQRGQIEPRVFIFSISIEQEFIYNQINDILKKKQYIKEIIINQIIQQMKFHLIVRRYYQKLIK